MSVYYFKTSAPLMPERLAGRDCRVKDARAKRRPVIEDVERGREEDIQLYLLGQDLVSLLSFNPS